MNYIPPYGQQVIVVPQSKTSGLAVASLVLGICGTFLGWMYLVAPILAIIFGGVAMRQIANSNGTRTGRGLAIAGLVLGIVCTVIYGLFLLALVGAASA